MGPDCEKGSARIISHFRWGSSEQPTIFQANLQLPLSGNKVNKVNNLHKYW